jgi:cellulose biosynthesis protein BcsQ
MDTSAPLRSLLLASRKGGAGKTTLALHLGVILGTRSKVLLIDADEQASASAWYRMRAADHPRLVACAPRQVRDVLTVAAAEGIEFAIIDTAGKAEVEHMMRLADFVLIPVRTAFLDLDAVARTVQSVHDLGKPGAIVLNAAPPPRGAGEASLTTAARIALTAYRLPIAPVAIVSRTIIATSLASGEVATEQEPRGKAAQQMRLLADYVEKVLCPANPALALTN